MATDQEGILQQHLWSRTLELTVMTYQPSWSEEVSIKSAVKNVLVCLILWWSSCKQKIQLDFIAIAWELSIYTRTLTSKTPTEDILTKQWSFQLEISSDLADVTLSCQRPSSSSQLVWKKHNNIPVWKSESPKCFLNINGMTFQL